MAKIYIKSINEWIETTKEEHDNYYKDINAYRRTQQNHGNCICSRQKYTTTATWTVTVANIMFQMIQTRLTVHMKMKTEMKPVW